MRRISPGRAFVGRSGKLLDRMMAAIGLDRSHAYIANVIPWRPPGNRTPTPQETAICLPFIRRQIELADPDILVCLGQPATQTLLGTREGITRTRGRWFKFDTGTREIRAIATLTPPILLRQPLQKRLAWRDFLAIKKALAGVIATSERMTSRTLRLRVGEPAAVRAGGAAASSALAGLITPQPTRNSGSRPCTGRSNVVRHFGHQIGKVRLDVGRRRGVGIGRRPDHDGALFADVVGGDPGRALRSRRNRRSAGSARRARPARRCAVAGDDRQRLAGAALEMSAKNHPWRPPAARP